MSPEWHSTRSRANGPLHGRKQRKFWKLIFLFYDKLKQTTAYKLAEIRSNEGERKRKAEEDKIKAAELAIQEAKEKKQREHEERIAAELAHAVSTCGVGGGWKFHHHSVVF